MFCFLLLPVYLERLLESYLYVATAVKRQCLKYSGEGREGQPSSGESYQQEDSECFVCFGFQTNLRYKAHTIVSTWHVSIILPEKYRAEERTVSRSSPASKASIKYTRNQCPHSVSGEPLGRLSPVFYAHSLSDPSAI